MEGKRSSAKVEVLSSREEHRYFNLIEKIKTFLQDVKADDIYNAMKDSEYSKEYAVQRLKEMFDDSMNNEKEIFISQLEGEIVEEKELNRVLQHKNMDLDQELINEREQVGGLMHEYERVKEELSKLQDLYKKQGIAMQKLEERARSVSETQEDKFDLARSQQITEELSFSKSQTLKLQKELDFLQRDKTIATMKENEYKKDHQDLVMHLKKMQNEKECLELEIEQLSQANYEMKTKLDIHINSSQTAFDQNRRLENSLREEVDNNRAEVEELLLKFKEKTRKFKSKIFEQKKRIDEHSQSKETFSKILENKIRDLEALAREKDFKINELEVMLERAEIENSLKLENGKKLFEQQMGLKLSEMQKEVQVQVKRCQDYERQIKSMTETKLKTLENKNSDLESAKQELKSQLTSALQSLEQLRGAYSDQLSSSEELHSEISYLKQLLSDYELESKENQSQIKSLQNLLDLEKGKLSQMFELQQEHEASIKHSQETEWKTRQDLEQALRHKRNLEDELENTLKDSRNSHRDNVKLSELLVQKSDLETYCQKLEKQVRVLTSHKKKFSRKGLASKFTGLKQSLRDLKGSFVSQFLALDNHTHSILEKISNKVIEKAAEYRKIRSQFSAVCKENTSLTQSVSICSKEMDVLSQEIADKQKTFKDGCKMVKIQMKEKFVNKLSGLERELVDVKREKSRLMSEAYEKIKILQGEVLYFQGREREVSEVLRKGSVFKEEIAVLEDRICELEQFLEAERTQKEQMASLKNKEIEEMRSRMKRLGVSNC